MNSMQLNQVHTKTTPSDNLIKLLSMLNLIPSKAAKWTDFRWPGQKRFIYTQPFVSCISRCKIDQKEN